MRRSYKSISLHFCQYLRSQFVSAICLPKHAFKSHCFYILGLAYNTIFYIPVKCNFYSSFKTKNINNLFLDRAGYSRYYG